MITGIEVSFGGACILVRTSCGRVSGTLWRELVHWEGGKRLVTLLVEIGLDAGLLETSLLSEGKLVDVAVHGVLGEC